jgi:hypothetical protein
VSEEDDEPQNPSDDDGRGETTDESNDTTNHRRKPNEIKMRAGQLEVEAKSVDESVGDLADIISDEMESLMRYHIRGEMEMLEEQDLHSIFLSDD